MTGRPDMIAQFAHYLSDFFAEEGHRAQVYCYVWVARIAVVASVPSHRACVTH